LHKQVHDKTGIAESLIQKGSTTRVWGGCIFRAY